ncbi:flagellar transcriptional regulator FlhD [Halomonas sp. McH1-25]|uniref:Flagellar transcriptional regulator FlhD n=1 Tax=Modicisalibacter xianhensis TaxID=442341 RepID=A0A1I2YSJ7_9GAMM|nr:MULTISPECIES: flagellar transcriptional regulator FlhD [Halomonas]MCP1364845.1 flagellar transcriptional regulator FlhD [Halomonas sp. BBD48]MCG7599336.1 flagellar transcriptional regulator FlhD [Halomonas sp. McH1-25]MCP1343838.1 flagellar transcriptional regulator FlhD [Halomonas sp. FL8]MCP1361117.1 flagellar transcriptional regulator FlhD [Halomonas sp. BBD45]TDX31638.1 flagellar transcriptional activator FlhD [Halomonas xianhensis]
MHNESLLEDIQEVNLAYLLLAQRMLKEDRETAMFRLKIDERMADLMASLSIKQLSQMARSNQLLCRLAYVDPDQLMKLFENPRELGMAQTHAALLMAADRFSSSGH